MLVPPGTLCSRIQREKSAFAIDLHKLHGTLCYLCRSGKFKKHHPSQMHSEGMGWHESNSTTIQHENYLALDGLPQIKDYSWWGRDGQAGPDQVDASPFAR